MFLIFSGGGQNRGEREGFGCFSLLPLQSAKSGCFWHLHIQVLSIFYKI